jgi:sarcosine oxidase, subunit beta
MSETINCDLLVIGAGIAGASAAFHAASQGIATVLVERDHPASGPTGRSSAMCHLFYTMPELSRLARRGSELLKAVPEIAGGPKVYHATGVLWCAGAANRESWRESVRRIRDEEGGGLDEISLAELARILPGFSTEGIAIAVWEPGYGHADPYDATLAFAQAARAKGARLLQRTSVTAIEVAAGKVQGARLSDGSRVAADRVIAAVGPWTRSLIGPLGVELPLSIERHGMAVLDAPGRAKSILPVNWVDDTLFHYARPEGENTILIGTWAGGGTGARHAEAHRPGIVAVPGEYDADFSTEESIWTLNHMLPRCPALGELGIRPGYACMYDMSPDDLPIIDAVPGAEGLYVVAGSSGHGFKLGPAVGEEAVRLAVTGASALLRPFALSRFEG